LPSPRGGRGEGTPGHLGLKIEHGQEMTSGRS